MTARRTPPGRRARIRLAAPAAAGCAALAAVWLVAAVPAAARQDQPFGGHERVTAVDLVVEVVRTLGPNAGAPLPDRLAAGDFTVEVDGAPRPVVTVETPEERAEPWRLVVWFDLGLARPEGVRWAARELGARAAGLTELGEVELVVADPTPRRALEPTRDPAALEAALTRIALTPPPSHQVVALRREFLELLDDPDVEGGPRELARTAARLEAAAVHGRIDGLLGWLAADDPGGPRRALLLAGAEYDTEVAGFYRDNLAAAGEGAAGATLDTLTGDLAAATRDLAATLAAYGWVVVGLGTPDREPPDWGPLRRVGVRMDDNWDPKLAAAHDELGRALHAQGKLEEAEEAFETAVHHYYDHPSTAAAQSETMLRLAAVLAERGDPDAADRQIRRALALDPTLAGRHPELGASMSDPLAPLTALAEATAGRLAREPEALDAALVSLRRRVRLTFQTAGIPDGELHPVTARLGKRTYRADAPRWTRSGTPEPIAALRARQALSGDEAGDGGLEVAARRDPESPGAVQVSVAPPPAADGQEPRQVRYRITFAAGNQVDPPTVTHHLQDPEPQDPTQPWSHDHPLAIPPGAQAVTVIEDLHTGRWGTARIAG
jgi:tetratricopeptide (TPR) repeat protein